MKIVADDKIPFLKGAFENLAEVVYAPGKQINREMLMDADAMLIRTRTKCTEDLLKGTSVRFIGTATIGFDHIDTNYCDSNDIAWTNAPGCNSSSVHQYITTALLKLARDHHYTLKDKTIGIAGVGNVGAKVANAARVFGMNVLLNDPPRERQEGRKDFVSLETVLAESDIISAHVPLSFVGEDKTYNLFNDKTFKKMKKGVWFINTCRGEVAENAALKKFLKSGRPAGAVIDVWQNEPDIDLDLMASAFIATPHIAGYSTDGKANGTAMVVNSLCRFFSLPNDNWYPSDVPEPSEPEININAKGKTDEDIIREAVFHTYDIEDDDIKLRFSPSDFEKLRGNYPLRREFSSYRVILSGGTKRVGKMLVGLGFHA